MPSLVIVLSLQSQAFGQTVREVPDNYPTAQLAVDAAANGDIVQFNDSVLGDFTVNAKQLNFQGVGGWVGTMNATGGADVTITGMTLYGGTTETDPALISAGIYCQALTPAAVDATNATVNVIDSTLRCFSTGAIRGDDADVTVTQSVFEYNYFDSAINVVGGDLHVEGSTFQYNAGFEGGGVHAEADNTEILTSYFYGNTTSLGGGGGLYVASDVAYVSGNNFLNNYNLLWWIPGLIVNDPSDLLGQDVGGLVVASGDGAGMYVTDPALAPATSVTVHDNTFCGNLGDVGAGLYVDDVEGIQIINNRFADNWSMHLGGGLYVRADSAFIDPAHIQNNTFMQNTAGIFPPPYPPAVVVIGGGGAVALDGTVADFRNNIIAYTPFGGGVMGVDGADYTIGDLVTVDYNILFWNCDAAGCPSNSVEDWAQFTGDMNEYALPATNLPLDPFPVYFGAGEFNCVPDAFYPTWGSPAVRNGDLTLPNKIDPNFSDIGSYGGPQANVLDRDGDLFENIYDCNDEPDQDGASVYPGAPDICDGLDNDCDGVIDEDFITNWYPDADGDGYGDVNFGQPIIDCVQPANTTSNRDDCNDNDPT
ncbi:MAG: putative metal-binding motif-containing protein, partial [Myxococcota bacterium]